MSSLILSTSIILVAVEKRGRNKKDDEPKKTQEEKGQDKAQKEESKKIKNQLKVQLTLLL